VDVVVGIRPLISLWVIQGYLQMYAVQQLQAQNKDIDYENN